MRRALPLWLAAVVPATLAGHGLAYALAGQAANDGRHAWVAPALECSLAILAAVLLIAIGSSLLRAGILTHTDDERSWFALWTRLALCQVVLFTVAERTEGAHVGIIGVLVQIVVAVLVAYALSAFAKMLRACSAGSRAATRYLHRLLTAASSYVPRRPVHISYALAIQAGTSRFQRPPPLP